METTQTEKPASSLEHVRLCAEVLGEVKIESKDQRDAALVFLDEISAWTQSVVRDSMTTEDHVAVQEAWNLFDKVHTEIKRYQSHTAIVHCDECQSSFCGYGPTDLLAFEDASEGLVSHVVKFHGVKS